MLFQRNISDRRFRVADYDQIHFFAFVTNLQPRPLLSSGTFVHMPETVTFSLPSSAAISFVSIERRWMRSRSDLIMPTINPAVAIRMPRSAPPDLRIFERAM